jgi:hypothetical protein
LVYFISSVGGHVLVYGIQAVLSFPKYLPEHRQDIPLLIHRLNHLLVYRELPAVSVAVMRKD